MNLIDLQRASAAKHALRDIDEELARTTYAYDRDRLLDQRNEVSEYQRALNAGQIPQ